MQPKVYYRQLFNSLCFHLYHLFVISGLTRSAPSSVVVSKKNTTSVRVSWQAVEDADRYNVTLSKTQGTIEQRGPCYGDSHTVSVVTSGLRVVVGKTAEDMLRPFTTYSVIVVAENDTSGSSEPSDPIRFTTKKTSEFDILIGFVNFGLKSLIKMHQCLLVMSQL